MTATDQDHMARAIALARQNLGATGANPVVGCVIVLAGEVVGEGVTAPGGRPHAEELALLQAGSKARGATAFVTLEPCGARSAGGLSCAERLAAAGLARVAVACSDPSAFAAGLGLAHLRAAGVALDVGLSAEAAAFLYGAYRPAGGSRGDE